MTLAMRNNVDEQRPIPADILRASPVSPSSCACGLALQLTLGQRTRTRSIATNGIVGLFVGFLCLYVLALLATAIAVRREHQFVLWLASSSCGCGD